MQEESSSENPLDRQPARAISLERQPTQPMMAAQNDIAQQPTQPMVVKHPDQRAVSPMPVKPDKRLRLRLTVLLSVILLVGLLLGDAFTQRAAIGNWLSHTFTHTAPSSPVVHVHVAPPSPSQATLIATAAKSFMNAMTKKDWADMWSMLTPAAQQLWQGKKDFIHFEQAKFGSLKFITYKDTPAQIQSSWLDPDTTQVYTGVATLRVSLAAAAPRGLLTAPSSAALDNGLFNNIQFALLPYHSSWRVLLAGPADLDAPVLVPASPPATELLVPIFMYHHVSNQPTKNLLDYGLTVRTTDFNAQLTWLQQQGYHGINLIELFDALYYGKALPAHPMILSFDDGYKDMYTDALPALMAHHYRGVFFIITGMIGGNYLTWNQVRTLARDGMQVASHTVHHVNIGEPPAGTTTQEELVVSKSMLQTLLGRPIQFFCYPSGEPFHHDSVYEQMIVLTDLLADGYVGATLDPFAFDSAIQDARTPYLLPRIRVSGGEDLRTYIGILQSTLQYGAEKLA